MWKSLFGCHRFVSLFLLQSWTSDIFIQTCFTIAKLLQLSGTVLRSNSWDRSLVNPNHYWSWDRQVIICNELAKLYHSVCSPRRRDGSDMCVNKNVPWVASTQRAGWFFIEEVMSGQASWNMSSAIMPLILSKIY